MLGTLTLEREQRAEVTNISPFGFWILAGDREYFVDFEEYPAFEDASVLAIATVKADAAGNLHWPLLDADIELLALEHPQDYPLVYT